MCEQNQNVNATTEQTVQEVTTPTETTVTTEPVQPTAVHEQEQMKAESDSIRAEYEKSKYNMSMYTDEQLAAMSADGLAELKRNFETMTDISRTRLERAIELKEQEAASFAEEVKQEAEDEVDVVENKVHNTWNTIRNYVVIVLAVALLYELFK